jgi:hypothetical protein
VRSDDGGGGTDGTRPTVTVRRHAALCAKRRDIRVSRRDDVIATARSYPRHSEREEIICTRSFCRDAAGRDLLALAEDCCKNAASAYKQQRRRKVGCWPAKDVETRPLGSQCAARMNSGRGRHELAEQVQTDPAWRRGRGNAERSTPVAGAVCLRRGGPEVKRESEGCREPWP